MRVKYGAWSLVSLSQPTGAGFKLRMKQALSMFCLPKTHLLLLPVGMGKFYLFHLTWRSKQVL